MDELKAQVAELATELARERQARQAAVQAAEQAATTARTFAEGAQIAATNILAPNTDEQTRLKDKATRSLAWAPRFQGSRGKSFRQFRQQYGVWRSVNRLDAILDVDFNKNCLLAVMSEGAADLVQDCGPDSETWNKARTYEQYMTALSQIFEPPEESEMARDLFESRKQKKDENINQYITSKINLFRAAYPNRTGNFSTLLSQTIQGVYNSVIRRKLTYANPKDEIELKREATLAVAFKRKCFKNHCSESVSLDGLAPTGQYMGQTGQDPVIPMEIDTIQKLRGSQTEKKCGHCKKTGHTSESCWELVGRRPQKNQKPQDQVVCNWCRKTGHVEKECRGKSSGRVPNRVPAPARRGKVNTIEEEEKSDTKDDESTLEGDTDHFLDQTPGEEETE